MRLTIVAEDGVVGVGGTFYQVDLTGFPADVRAVQFYGTEGDVEYNDGKPNASINSIAAFQTFIDRWQTAHGLATAPPPPPTLAEVKALKVREVEQARDAATIGNVTAHARQWQADERSQKLLSSAITLGMAGAPLPAAWRDVANNNMTITTLAELVAIAGAMAVQTQDAYSKSWTLKANVQAATTVAEVNAVVW